MLGWLAPILNLLGLGAGTPNVPPPPVDNPYTVYGLWDTTNPSGMWDANAGVAAVWEDK